MTAPWFRMVAGAGLLCALSSSPAWADPPRGLDLAVEGGVSTMNESGPFGYGSGVGATTNSGLSWGIRVGHDFKRWLALDAHYIGMANGAKASYAPGGDVSLMTNALIAEVRLTVPTPHLQPYFFTGPGIYATSVVGSDAATKGSPFMDSTEFGIPIGLGLAVPVTSTVTVGGELTYHRLFGEKMAADDEVGGGDLTTVNIMLRVRL